MSVHYKFKSSKDFDTVTFDGLHISIGELKKNIIQQKKIGKNADYELQITNAQTKEVYDSDDTLVAKNTSVLVSRIPIVGANKKNWRRETSDTDALLEAEVAASSVCIPNEEGDVLGDNCWGLQEGPHNDRMTMMAPTLSGCTVHLATDWQTTNFLNTSSVCRQSTCMHA